MASRKPKYADVCANLPRLPGGEPERRDALEGVQREVLTVAGEVMSDEFIEAQIRGTLNSLQADVDDLYAWLKAAPRGRRQAAALAQAYTHARVAKDALKDHLSNVQLIVDALEELMVLQMEAEGVASMRLASGGSVSTYQEPYPSVVDKEAFRQWCIAQGLERDMHLWPSKAAALVKDLLLSGETEPPGVSTYAKTMVRLNKP